MGLKSLNRQRILSCENIYILEMTYLKTLQTEDYRVLLYLWEAHVEEDLGFLAAHHHHLIRLNHAGFLTIVYNQHAQPKMILFSQRALHLFRKRHRQRYEHQHILASMR